MNDKKTIFLCETLDSECMSWLNEHYYIVDNFDNPFDIQGIITRKIAVTKEIMDKCPNLKVISDHGTGTDQIDMAYAAVKGIKVTNTPGLNAQSVAELALSLMLSLSYKVKYNNCGMLREEFKKFAPACLMGNELTGKKVGIIGSGYTAQKLSNMLKLAFNCDIFCYNPHRTSTYLEKLGFTAVESLEDLFQQMDFISIHAPLTVETKNIIDLSVLKKSNPKLILVNTSRGGIVNETDLYYALTHNLLNGAGSDVFDLEPPDPLNPLLALDNFIGTLHVGGNSEESLKRVGWATVRNLVEGLGDSMD